jgi:uncharacterized membrane protein YfcA
VPAGDLLAVAAVVVFAGAVQLTTGFGFALAAVPLMALAIDPHDAVIITLALATFSNGYQAFEGRAAGDRPVALRMLAGAALGLPIGLWVFVVADPAVLRLGIGIAVIGAVVALARGVDLREASAALDVASGVVSGALTTSVGTNGPPLVFVLQARDFPPDRFRATITRVFFVLDIGSIVVFGLAGEIDRGIVEAVAVALPALFVGAVVGVRLRSRLDPRRFRRTVMVLLVLAAVSAIVSAAVSWDNDEEGESQPAAVGCQPPNIVSHCSRELGLNT